MADKKLGIKQVNELAGKMVKRAIGNAPIEMQIMVQRSIRKHIMSLYGSKNFQEKSEYTHKALLNKLFTKYQQTLPENEARDKAATEYLKLLTDPRFISTLVLTAHTTEYLPPTAIAAEQDLHTMITDSFPNWRSQNFGPAIKAFARTIKPITKKKTAEDEIGDALRGSENLSNAAIHELGDIVEALDSIGYDVSKISFDFLSGLRIMRVNGWGSSDNDSRILKLEWSQKGEKRYIEGRYRRNILMLAKIGSQLPEGPENDEARKLINSTIWRCIGTISNLYANDPKEAIRAEQILLKISAGEPKYKRHLRGEKARSYLADIVKVWQDTKPTLEAIRQKSHDALNALQRLQASEVPAIKELEQQLHQASLMARDLIINQLKTFLLKSQPPIAFSPDNRTIFYRADEFAGELKALKTLEEKGVAFAKSKVNARIGLTLLDELIFDHTQFGQSAINQEYRQSAKAYKIAFDQLVKFVKEDQKVLTQAILKVTKEKSLTPAVLLNIIRAKTGPKATLAAQLREYIHTKIQDPELTKMHSDELERVISGIQQDFSAENKAKFYFIDALQKLGYFTSRPELVPIFLMAELQESDDFIRVQFMIELMTNQKLKEKNPFIGANVLASLIEYQEQLLNFVSIIKTACKNPDFRNVIKERMTPQYAGTLFGTFICMAAGSDSYKSASSASNRIIKEAFEELRAFFIEEFGVDILDAYMGNGSGYHRNVFHTYLHFTIQGLQMRWNPDFLSDYLQQSKTVNLMRELGFKPKERIMAAHAVTNFGNRHNLKDEPTLTRNINIEKDRLRMVRYDGKYNYTSTAAHTSSSTPVPTEKGQSKANRPAGRLTYGDDEDEPLQKILRAIGWGQSNNNNGSTALQLFFDLSETIAENEHDLNADGSFRTAEARIKAAKRYLESAYLQDSVNRAANYIALSDMEMGWQFVAEGCNQKGLQISKKGNIITIAGRHYDINELIQFTPELLNRELDEDTPHGSHMEHLRLRSRYNELRDHICKHAGKNGIECLHAILGASMVDTELNKTARTISEMLSCLSPDSQFNGLGEIQNLRTVTEHDSSPEGIIKQLSRIDPEYGAELEIARAETQPARKAILADFKVKGKKSEALDQLTHLNYGILRDQFESPSVVAAYASLDNSLGLTA